MADPAHVVFLGGHALDGLTAVAHARRIPIAQALGEIIDQWTPTAGDAIRARGRMHNVLVWIDSDLQRRLGRVARERGVPIYTLVEEALR